MTAPRTSLAEIAWVFLRLGTTSFGGPAAHIAMMDDEVVRRRGWLSREQFLDFVGATNLIPGPNSTELAIHIGDARRGWPGLLVAGVCFIVPATLLVAAAAWAYVRFGALPEVAGVLYGVKPVVIAIVAQALVGLGRAAIKSRRLVLVAVAATIATAAGVNELVVLASSGVCMALSHFRDRPSSGKSAATLPALLLPLPPSTLPVTIAGALVAAPFALGTMFSIFVKIGAVLYGSGYVLLAFLRADFVDRLGWLTEQQLLDATAIGQVTPGPVFTTATFVGYLLGGASGAALATVGIFLPAFLFVAASGPLVPRLRRSAMAGATLDGVNVASLALMAVVTWQLGRASLIDLLAVVLALAALVGLVRFRVNTTWLILGGALIGWLSSLAEP